MKKKMIIFVAGACCLALASLSAANYLSSPIVVKQTTFVYELGEDIPTDISSFVSLTSSSKEKECHIDLSEIEKGKKDGIVQVGNYTITLSYHFYEYPLEIIVEDTVAPVFEGLPDKITLQKEDTKESLPTFVATDLDSVTVMVDDAGVSYGTVGEYELTLTAKDASGNIVSQMIPVIIEDEKDEIQESGNEEKAITMQETQTTEKVTIEQSNTTSSSSSGTVSSPSKPVSNNTANGTTSNTSSNTSDVESTPSNPSGIPFENPYGCATGTYDATTDTWYAQSAAGASDDFNFIMNTISDGAMTEYTPNYFVAHNWGPNGKMIMKRPTYIVLNGVRYRYISEKVFGLDTYYSTVMEPFGTENDGIGLQTCYQGGYLVTHYERG